MKKNKFKKLALALGLAMSLVTVVGFMNPTVAETFYDMSHYPEGARDELYDGTLMDMKNGDIDEKTVASLCHYGAFSPEYTKKFVDAGYLKEYIDEFVAAGILPESYASGSSSNNSNKTEKEETAGIASFQLSKNQLTLKVGDKHKLSLLNSNTGKAVSSTEIKWCSKNKEVAKVTKKGVVKAKTAGKTTIVVKYNNQKYKCKVVVSE